MTAPKTLYTLNISHFCEKARWALDWHAIDYEEEAWPPGPHRVFAKRLNAPSSSLPILTDGSELVQGSTEIMDWAERHSVREGASFVPVDPKDAATASTIEDRVNAGIGIHVRRLAYSETLPHQAHLFRPTLLKCTRPYHQFLGTIMWPITKRLMIKAMKIDPSQAPDARARLEEELDWLDGLLADGRDYLVGNRFSRADLTAASLLAPFARPDEAPRYRDLPLTQALARDEERWRDRPSMRWARTMYALHRLNRD